MPRLTKRRLAVAGLALGIIMLLREIGAACNDPSCTACHPKFVQPDLDEPPVHLRSRPDPSPAAA